MLDALLPYYERELGFLRQQAGAFAARHPRIARRLQMEADPCEDPHVGRLLEGFAFLAARIHRRLDDDYPEIAEAFLQVLYPHYTQPIPSASILQCGLDPEKPETTGRYIIPRHQQAISPKVKGHRCTFRTARTVDLWPLQVVSARLDQAVHSEHLRRTTRAAAVLTLELETIGGIPFAALPLDHLRFYLDGEPGLVHLLYELLFSQAMEVRLSDGTGHPGSEVRLPGTALRPVGFEREEALLAQDPRSLPGYRLLTEYFAFPEAFHFVDVTGLDDPRLRHSGQRLRIQIHFRQFGESERHARLVQQIRPDGFRLGCTPILNLFPHAAEPIRLHHQTAGYPVVVNHRRSDTHEVHSIVSVCHSESVDMEGQTPVQPFYALGDPLQTERPRFYWNATRTPSHQQGDHGTDLTLSLVDLDFQPVRCDSEVLSLELLCTNRDLPQSIPFGGGRTLDEDFSLPGHSAVKTCRLLRKPTPTLRPPAKRGHQWRLISHLSLSQTSLLAHGRGPLQQLLELYNSGGSGLIQRQIAGLVDLEARPGHARLGGQDFVTFARGLDVLATFDEACFTGANLLLFAQVLERFLAHCCPPNSFIRFHLLTRQREGAVVQWPPRVGDTPLI